MASSRKKQDENNLKTLRELVALPQNKFCFDCGQRGPTYVNITIGSFVCTKCSGILRGLTPPHRVKSISMATFTVEEIDTLRSKGNDYCRTVWLGLYEGPTPTFSGDEQQVRDFMIDKYERKRYYLETLNNNNLKRTNAIKRRIPKEFTNDIVPNGTVPNGIITNGTSRSRPEVKNHNCVNNLGNNFAVDFDKADIFSNTMTSSTRSSQSSQQNGFADFEHNAVYNASSNAATNGVPTSSALNAWATQQAPANPHNGLFNGLGTIASTTSQADDKYAALKDLDNEMKQHQQQDVWSTSNTGSTGSLYCSSTPTTGSIYGSPSPQGSIFGSPSQGQFMNAFTPLQENTTQTANPFSTTAVSNPWANTNGFCNGTNGFTNGTNGFANGTNNFANGTNGFTNGTNGFTNGTNGFSNGAPNGFINGISGLNGSQQGFVNPFRDQGKTNGFSHVLQPIPPSNGINAMSDGWGGNPFKVGTVTTMNTNNPFL